MVCEGLAMSAQMTFRHEQNETDKTEQTDVVRLTNEDFLEAVFHSRIEGAFPILVSFHGSPANVSKKDWSGFSWNIGNPCSLDTANSYFSLAVFNPDENGVYRRKKRQFAALHALMLDDVGTKVPLDRLTLRPSWLLETSEGNYQAGYLLADPITDPDLADRLMEAVIEAGLCDPGAGGPTARSSTRCSGRRPTAGAASSGSTASPRSCTSSRSTT